MPSLIINLVIAGLLLAGPEQTGLPQTAIAGDPPTIYRLIASETAGTAVTAYGQDRSGEAVARWEFAGDGRALEVTPDAGRAIVVAFKPAGGRRSREASSGVWTLTVIDLTTGKTTEPISLGLVPSTVTLLASPRSEPKLLVATTGRIAAYSLDPPRTSWFYTSPGMNSAIAAGGAGLVAILRGSSLALIEPARRPRVEGRLQLTDDDATSSINLAAEGLAVAMSNDGAVAAVLHEDRLTVSLIDVAAGRVMGTRVLSEPYEHPVLRILTSPGTGYRLIVGTASPLPAMAMIEIDAPPAPAAALAQAAETPGPPEAPAAFPEPAPPVAEPSILPAAEPEKAPEPQPESEPKAEPAQKPDSEPKAEPAQKPDSEPKTEPGSEPDAEKKTEPAPEPAPSQVPEPEPPPDTAPEPVPAAPPPPTHPSDEAFLSGTITGATSAAREVRFFGPNNIVKLRARAPIGTDGTFRVALPPAGSYRVVITGDPGAHLFTHPEFRMVIVGTDGKGVSGIDFEVRGRL